MSKEGDAMTKVKLYIARHGKTMFNTIGRAQLLVKKVFVSWVWV